MVFEFSNWLSIKVKIKYSVSNVFNRMTSWVVAGDFVDGWSFFVVVAGVSYEVERG